MWKCSDAAGFTLRRTAVKQDDQYQYRYSDPWNVLIHSNAVSKPI